MIFRALFFIGLVSLLMPHEPDLGLGRPGAGASLLSPATVVSAVRLPQLGQSCDSGACAGGGKPFPSLGPFATLKSLAGLGALEDHRGLAQIKAEIGAAIAARAARRQS